MTFYIVLGFVVARIYEALPKKNMRLAHLLVVLIVLGIWHDNRDSSKIWVFVSFVEMLIGGALPMAYRITKDRLKL